MELLQLRQKGKVNYTYITSKVQSTYANNATTNNSSNEDKKRVRWHERYGHLNFQDLNKLKREDMVKNMYMKSTRDKFMFEICDKEKIHQLP